MYVNQMNGDLFSLFEERKENFISSLQRSLSVVASDKMISQMFEDNCSANFVPDRILELIRQILNDDRENFLSQTIQKLNSIEACFGADTLKDIQAIGLKIIDLASDKTKQEEKDDSLNLFKEQLKQLLNKYDLIQLQPKKIITYDPKKINDLQQTQNSFRLFFIESTKNLIKIIRKAKEKSINEVQNMQNTIQVISKENKKIKKENNASKKALNEIIQEREKILNHTGGKNTTEFIEDMKKETEHSNKQRDIMNEQISKLKEMNNQLLTATQNLNKQVELITHEKKGIENQFNHLQITADNRLTEIKSLKQEQQSNLLEFQSQINKMKNRSDKTIKDANNEINTLKNTATNYLTTIQKMTSQIQTLNESIQREKDKSEKLTIQVSGLENDNQKNQQTISNLKSKIKLLKEESQSIKKNNDSIFSTNKSLQQLNDQITEQTTKISELKSQIFEKDSKISNLARESTSIKVSEVELNNLKASNKAMTSRIDEMNQSINKLKIELDNQKSSEKIYKSKIDKLSRENENLEKQNISNKSTIETLRSIKISNDGKSGQIEMLIMQNEELTKKNQLIENELSELQNLNKKLQTQLSSHQQKMLNLEPNNDDSSSTIETSQQLISLNKHQSKKNNKLKKENKSLKQSIMNISQERDEIFENLVSFRDQLYEELSVKSEIDLLVKIKTIKENENLISQVCNILNITNSSMIPVVLQHKFENMKEIQNLLNVENEEAAVSFIRRNSFKIQNENSTFISNINNDQESMRILNRIIPMLKVDEAEKVPEQLHKLILREADNTLIINQILKLLSIDDQSQIVSELHSRILKEKEKSDILYRIFNVTTPMSTTPTLNNTDLFQINDSFAFIQKIKDLKRNSDDYKKVLFHTKCQDITEFQKVKEKYESDSKILQKIQAAFSLYDDNDELVEKIIDLRDWYNQSCKILTINDDNSDTKTIVNSIQQLKIDLIDKQAAISEKEEVNQQLESQLTELESQLTEISGFVTDQKSRTKDIMSLRSSILDSNKRTRSLQYKLEEKENIINQLQQTISLNQDEISQLKYENDKANSTIFDIKKKMLKKLKKERSRDRPSFSQSLQNKSENTSFESYDNNNNNNDKVILKTIGNLLNSTDPNKYINEIKSLKSQVDLMNEQLSTISTAISNQSTDPSHIKVDQIIQDYNISNSIFDKLYRILNVSSKDEVVPAVSDLNKSLNNYMQKEKMLLAATNANSDVSLLATIKEMSQAIETIKNNFGLSETIDVIEFGELYSLISASNISDFKFKIINLKEKEQIFEKIKTIFLNSNLELYDDEGDLMKENNKDNIDNEIPTLLSSLIKYHSKSHIRTLCQKLNVESYSQLIDKINKIYDTYNQVINMVGTENLIEAVSNLLSHQKNISQLFNQSNFDSGQIEDQIQELIKDNQAFSLENKKIKEILSQQKNISQVLNQSTFDSEPLENQIQDLIKTNQELIQINQNFSLENQKIKEILSQQKNISQLLNQSTFDSEKIESQIQDLIKTNQELIQINQNFSLENKKIKEILKVENDSEIQPKLNELTETQKFYNKLIKKLTKRKETKLCSLFSSKNPSEICNRIQKVKSLLNTLNETLGKQFFSENNLNEDKEMDEEENIKIIIDQIKKKKENLNELSLLLKCSSATFDLNEIKLKIKSLITSNQENEIFNQEIEKSLSSFINVNQFKDSNSNQETLKIFVEKINSIFSHYAKLCEESQNILNKALSYGFMINSSSSSKSIGKLNSSINIYEAFEFVLTNELKMEQQKSLMENHKSLSELREMTQKEREILENQKQKAYSIIQQLKRSVTKEKESQNIMKQKLLDEKQKRKIIESELEHQKEINKSLNSLINNDAHK